MRQHRRKPDHSRLVGCFIGHAFAQKPQEENNLSATLTSLKRRAVSSSAPCTRVSAIETFFLASHHRAVGRNDGKVPSVRGTRSLGKHAFRKGKSRQHQQGKDDSFYEHCLSSFRS